MRKRSGLIRNRRRRGGSIVGKILLTLLLLAVAIVAIALLMDPKEASSQTEGTDATPAPWVAATATPEVTAAPTATPAPTAGPTTAPTSAPRRTSTPRPTASATPSPSPSATPAPTATPTPTATPAATATPAVTATPAATATPASTAAVGNTGGSSSKGAELVNAYREENSKAALSVNSELASAAAVRAREIVQNFSHVRPDGSDALSISSIAHGENIAMGTNMSAEGAMKAWKDSASHNENILRSEFSQIGVGYYQVGDLVYWVQLFG